MVYRGESAAGAGGTKPKSASEEDVASGKQEGTREYAAGKGFDCKRE